MRAAWLSAFVIWMSIGCSPPEASAPEEGERPCTTDEDCELAGRDTSVRSSICGNRAAGYRDSVGPNALKCGPMADMKPPSLVEPVLACFRGTCVPIDSRR